MIDTFGPIWRHYQQAAEFYASSHVEKAMGGVHGEDGNCVSDTGFVSRLGR